MTCKTCQYKEPNIVKKLLSFVGAVTSGKDDELGKSRLAICLASERVLNPRTNKLDLSSCPEMERDGGKLYCKACNCPKTRFSELKSKTQHRELECPLGKW